MKKSPRHVTHEWVTLRCPFVTFSPPGIVKWVTYEMSHITYEGVTSDVKEPRSHVTYERVVWHMVESPHDALQRRPRLLELCSESQMEWVTSHMNESRHIWTSHVTYERVTSHMNESRHIWTSHVTYEWATESCYVLGVTWRMDESRH